jgi:ABC-2 type transport system permease protein
VTWQAVAHKDFQDAVRSRWLIALSVFFVGFIGGVPALLFGYYAPADATAASLFGASGSFPLLGLSLSFSGVVAFVVAFIALVTSHGSIIDERESGTLNLLLSLPHSRRDVVLGKVVGRSAVVTVPVLAGYLVAIVALVATGTTVEFGQLVPAIALTVLVAMVFVAIGVALSASAESNRQATLGIFGLYFLLAFLWSLVARGFPALLNAIARRVPGLSPMESLAVVKLRMVVKYLNPLRAYETLVAEVFFGDVVQARLLKAGFGEQIVLNPALKESVPFYFTGWFIFLVLLAWIVVPPVLGYLSFRDVDL